MMSEFTVTRTRHKVTALELEEVLANVECAGGLVRDACERTTDAAARPLLHHIVEMLEVEVKRIGNLADRLASAATSTSRMPAGKMLRLVPGGRDSRGSRGTAVAR